MEIKASHIPKHIKRTTFPSTRSPLQIPHDGVSYSESVSQSTYVLTKHYGELELLVIELLL